MSLRVVVLGKILLVRQPIAQSLGTLDFEIFESSDFAEVIANLDITKPSLVVMDADGMSREWRTLAAALGARQGAAALVLVTSRFSFDDAHDALALRVAGVIVKPFRREEHTPRLLDLALRKMNVRARRASPRFAVPATMNAVLRLPMSDGEDVFPLKNIAEGGATIDMEAGAAGSSLAHGSFVPLATLSWGDVQLEAELSVVHREANAGGVRFSRFFDGAPNLFRALKERNARALGSHGRRRSLHRPAQLPHHPGCIRRHALGALQPGRHPLARWKDRHREALRIHEDSRGGDRIEDSDQNAARVLWYPTQGRDTGSSRPVEAYLLSL